ncbi:signal peptidase I [Brachybacterium hainanense]|uniref:Signal peptidase I n=1 Tax=Brachybacterium hainanense TaxID=1541174 RepID=A0ABV6RF18_9MICO
MSTSTPATGSAGDPGHEPDTSGARDEHLASAPSGRARRRTRGGGWLEYLVTMVGALVIAVLVKTFLIQPFYIPSSSMEPTLQVNDKIIVSKLSPGVIDLERGDVIVFQDPADWIEGDATVDPSIRTRIMMALSLVGLVPDPSQDHLVKRLIGLPGDHVVCEEKGGALTVNGETLEEPYINPETPACQEAFDVTVPEDSLWVMGDNRFASADSVYHYSHGEEAYVPVENVTGKAVAIFWPVGHWTGLGDGHATFASVPDPA